MAAKQNKLFKVSRFRRRYISSERDSIQIYWILIHEKNAASDKVGIKINYLKMLTNYFALKQKQTNKQTKKNKKHVPMSVLQTNNSCEIKILSLLNFLQWKHMQ